jgi:uncharacterized protein YbjT (DUF2867 family)
VTVLVTGATGKMGREVLEALRVRGIEARAACRQPGEAGAARLDFTRPETHDAALEGSESMFLMRPPAITRIASSLGLFVKKAVAAGVQHAVVASVTGADSHRLLPHRALEDCVKASGMAWTLLRIGFFAQNFADAYRQEIVERDAIRLPAGQAEVAFVDLRDVADLVAEVLLDPERGRSQAWNLTGPRSFSFSRAAKILTEVTGRTIRYEPVGAWRYLRDQHSTFGLGRAAIQTVLHVLLRRGTAARVDPTLGRLLDHPPRDLEDYLRDHAHLWVK